MLDYSGCLLHGLRQMGADDVFESLRTHHLRPALPPLRGVAGLAWGHAVAPSTPAQDYRLHVRAWQHHFAGDLRPGGARARAGLLPGGDGAAEPSRRVLTSS